MPKLLVYKTQLHLEVRSTKSQKKERLKICRVCPSHKGKILGVSIPCLERCGECGCFLRAKTELKFAVCPKGKW